jgi:GntR family transcriptional regulator, rspAB operon transcriptional repressor
MNDTETASLAREAYLILRQRILRGELPIGGPVSRRKLATELGMSFLPVSEAMLRLEFEGLLESRPRAGTRVRIPTPQDVRGNYLVREALEGQAARLFAEVATDEEMAELKKLAVRVDTLGSQPESLLIYLTLHEKLHRRIAECARCPALSEAIEKTHALSSTWFCNGHPASPDTVTRRHQELMVTIARRNPHAAAAAMQEHVSSSMDRALERLKPYFDLGRTNGNGYSRAAKSGPPGAKSAKIAVSAVLPAASSGEGMAV